jgi:hypothetical protein
MIAGRTTLAVGLVLMELCARAPARSHPQAANPFTATLQSPYETALVIVKQVVEDGIIRGSTEYQREYQITGASSAPGAGGFAAADASSEVLVKSKTGALAPTHFRGSNDSGMVRVLYRLQALGPKTTLLEIEAEFIDDGQHRRFRSDGSVEAAEFNEIDRRLKALAAATEPETAYAFEIDREMTAPFGGEWPGLRGKNALLLWARPVLNLKAKAPADAKLAFAKHVFRERYQLLGVSPESPEGVVLVFPGAQGVIAASRQGIQAWLSGIQSEEEFLRSCSLDPPGAFSTPAVVSSSDEPGPATR